MNPRSARFCLTIAMNGARSMVTWPLLTRDRAALPGQGLHQGLVGHGVDLNPGIREPVAGHDLVHGVVYVPGDRAGDRRAERLEQGADPGQALAGQQGRGLVGVAGHVEVAGDRGRDLVGQRVLDRRVMDQRLDVRDVAVGVGDLVGGPDPHHRQRGEHAADHDEQRGDGGPPGDAVPPWLVCLLAPQFGHLGAKACQFGPFVLAETRGLCRAVWFAVGRSHGSFPPDRASAVPCHRRERYRATAVKVWPRIRSRCSGLPWCTSPGRGESAGAGR